MTEPNDPQGEQQLPISLFDYDLPDELIAQEPLHERSASRLLVLERSTGAISHSEFTEVTEWLHPGDLLVINDTRVFPARVMARRETGGQVELLLLRSLGEDLWQAMVRPARRLHENEYIEIVDQYDQYTGLRVQFIGRQDDGTVLLSIPDAAQVLERAGRVPLPSYISASLADPERYQTVYAREAGSVAAPTAGLHFTKELLEKVAACGVEVARITLHVGPGTFQPVKVENALQHQMHAERYQVSSDSLSQIRQARSEGRRVIAVGTTSCRTLEAIAGALDHEGPLVGETALYITPGFEFKVVDGLLTNFHLPRSTLLLLVSAFANRELVLRSYAEAIKRRYRFYSFGDAMLIV
jgi:S-adenosylmethionine:tRNA ribosyltransferase-isomerase